MLSLFVFQALDGIRDSPESRGLVDWYKRQRQVRALRPIRPLTKLSWSALRNWRDCPYRHLLERGYALRREEEVQAEFQAMDYGNLVHRALQEWLDPRGAGYAALAADDVLTARSALAAAAAHHFEEGATDLPQRRLWFESFRGLMDGIVAVEQGRFADWRPLVLEQEFALPLPVLRDWVAAAADPAEPVAPLPPHGHEVVLRGVIDRVDRHCDGTGALAVIDYKTGVIPTRKSVVELEELQILLYALAVDLGAVALPGAGPHAVRESFYYGVNGKLVGGPASRHFDRMAGDDDQLLREAARQLVAMAVAAADPAGAFPVLPREMSGEGTAQLPCRYCDWRGVCRVEEMAVPPGTARKLDKMVNRKD